MDLHERLLTAIREEWGWTGLAPAAVIATNDFGNVVIRAEDGQFWRICPEALFCKVIARDFAEFEVVWADEEFQLDWQMSRMVAMAAATLGAVAVDRCLKVNAILGGQYAADDFGVITREEVVRFAGNLAWQLKDLPDGAQVRLVTKEKG